MFWISGFTALPAIYDRLTTPAAVNGAYWAPQVIGGTGFIISGTLFMIETQKKWYLPAFDVLGWHIGAWNLIGVCSLSQNLSQMYFSNLGTGNWVYAMWCSWICECQQWCGISGEPGHVLGVVVFLDRQCHSVVRKSG